MLERHGAHVEILADRSLVATYAAEGQAATDQAALAACNALLLKQSWPEAVVALSTGRGRAAIAGQGVAILNSYFWKAEIEAGLLVEPVPSYVVEKVSYWLVHPPHARTTPKVKAFRDWIIAELAQELARDPQHRFLPAEPEA
ncbi:LysR substrate-binding domain-containing protein [uncultured Caulobacter sp.]|uniref:LysR substrate-binding domain-containing protein n=1 Tax=uncultured Caulobacter sp. TaxID=158749 RepID=UPI00261F77CD|nr:LysR substrate-binding domain-containing protein [uncultured Caulobacter sp.]